MKLSNDPPRHNPKMPPNEAGKTKNSDQFFVLGVDDLLEIPKKPSHVMKMSRLYFKHVTSLK